MTGESRFIATDPAEFVFDELPTPEVQKAGPPDEARDEKGKWTGDGGGNGGGSSGADLSTAIRSPWPPHTDAEVEAGKAAHQAAVNRLVATLSTLDPKHDEHKKELVDALANMTTPAVMAAAEKVASITWYDSPVEITNAYAATGRKPSGPFSIGGFFDYHKDRGVGDLHVDGAGRGVLAHELAHAADWAGVPGHGGQYSDRWSWYQTWSEEIARPHAPLTQYATRDPHEGFAEALRAVATQPRVLRDGFPKTWALLRKWGFA